MDEMSLTQWDLLFKLRSYETGYFIVRPSRNRSDKVSQEQSDWLKDETEVFYVSTHKSTVRRIVSNKVEGAIQISKEYLGGLKFLGWHMFTSSDRSLVDLSLVNTRSLCAWQDRKPAMISSGAKKLAAEIELVPYEIKIITRGEAKYRLIHTIPFVVF